MAPGMEEEIHSESCSLIPAAGWEPKATLHKGGRRAPTIAVQKRPFLPLAGTRPQPLGKPICAADSALRVPGIADEEAAAAESEPESPPHSGRRDNLPPPPPAGPEISKPVSWQEHSPSEPYAARLSARSADYELDCVFSQGDTCDGRYSLAPCKPANYVHHNPSIESMNESAAVKKNRKSSRLVPPDPDFIDGVTIDIEGDESDHCETTPVHIRHSGRGVQFNDGQCGRRWSAHSVDCGEFMGAFDTEVKELTEEERDFEAFRLVILERFDYDATSGGRPLGHVATGRASYEARANATWNDERQSCSTGSRGPCTAPRARRWGVSSGVGGGDPVDGRSRASTPSRASPGSASSSSCSRSSGVWWP
eukprot:TRINITY_DN23386_c0_g1_i3.p1 TRINITY_DN23386_c0_g1~~TRINITY_DN23386_c0_g1_i3.p1  ORF type:complete len:366 (-),score=38.35 TRINITY_DN23386_c0_g1_i3:237-1334(-)